jgi:uncharacterized protein
VARYEGPIVDVDIHHRWHLEDELGPYLSERWRDYALGVQVQKASDEPRPVSGSDYTSPNRAGAVRFTAPGGVVAGNVDHGGRRRDSYPDNGRRPGSDYPTLKAQLLDPYNYFRGILTFDVGSHAGALNQYFAIDLCRAANDWNADQWLSLDERLYGVALAPIATPDAAAEEIRRAGKHPKIVATLMAGSPFERPYGDPVYDPVYKASAEMGLALHLHPGHARDKQHSGGTPNTAVGYVPLISQIGMRHIASFIVHGTFEKFPSLKVVVKEYGTAWLPYLIWRLDKNYKRLKLESPWVKKWPSEYIFEHIKVSTQPLEESENPKEVADVLTSVDGLENVMCFSSDYPHFTFDDPDYIVRKLPKGWARKVMCDNACAAYGWKPPAQDATFKRALAGVGAE